MKIHFLVKAYYCGLVGHVPLEVITTYPPTSRSALISLQPVKLRCPRCGWITCTKIVIPNSINQ